MNISFFAIHSATNGSVHLHQTHSLREARQCLADRIQNGLCGPRDSMAIVEWPSDRVVYMRTKNHSVEGVLNRSDRSLISQRLTGSGWFKKSTHPAHLATVQ